MRLKDTARVLAWEEGVRCHRCGNAARWHEERQAMVCDHCRPTCPDCKAPACAADSIGLPGEWVCPKCWQVLPHVYVSKSWRNRCALCGREARGSAVSIEAVAELDGGRSRAAVVGLRQCNRVWMCPTCARRRQAEDAAVLQAANLGFRAHDACRHVILLTLTTSHSARTDGRKLRRALSKAWSRAHTGAKEARRRKRFGILAQVRRLEQTDGANGAHWHIHSMLFLSRKLTEPELESLREWYFVHWGERVAKASFGRPTKEHGINISEADKDGFYLAKMGVLELSGDIAKHGRCPQCSGTVETRRDGDRTVCARCGSEVNRNRWQLLSDIADYESPRDKGLWFKRGRETHGARMLTWSRWKGGLNLRLLYPPDGFAWEETKNADGRARMKLVRQERLPFSDKRPSLPVAAKLWRKLSEETQCTVLELYEDGETQRALELLGEMAPPATSPFTQDDPKPAPREALDLTLDERTELAHAGVRLPQRNRKKAWKWDPPSA